MTIPGKLNVRCADAIMQNEGQGVTFPQIIIENILHLDNFDVDKEKTH